MPKLFKSTWSRAKILERAETYLIVTAALTFLLAFALGLFINPKVGLFAAVLCFALPWIAAYLLVVTSLNRKTARPIGLKLMKIGANLYFDYERPDGKVGDAQLQDDADRVKHAVNFQTDMGAQAESGGHILREVGPIPKYVSFSVINVLRDPETYLGDEIPVNKYKDSYTVSEYEEHWGEQSANNSTKKTD